MLRIESGAYIYHLTNGVVTHVGHDGKALVGAASTGEWDGMADPRHGGIGAFGVHIARPPFPEKGREFERARHVENLREGNWGVIRSDTVRDGDFFRAETELGDEIRRPLINVKIRWRFRGPVSTAIFDVTTLDAIRGLYAKEPKIGVSALVGRGTKFVVRDSKRRLIRERAFVNMSDPRKKTLQITEDNRRHVAITGTWGTAHITGGGLPLTSLGVFGAEDSRYGLAKWRREAADAPKISSRDSDKAYCWCGKLRASWEVIAWPDRTGILMHGWTGGVGFHDCVCAYRLVRPGLRFRYYLRVRFE